MIVAQLALFGQLVVEAILAGHLDGRVLAAVALGGSIGFVGNILCSGVMLAVPPSVAQLDGALRRGEVAALFRQALLLALAVGLVLGAVSYWGGPALIAGIGTPPDLARDATAYLRASALGLPAVAVFFACRGTSEGLSMPRPTVLISAASLIVLLPLGYTLMYNASGVAAQARGAGLAGCLVSTLEAVIFAAWLRFGRPYRGIGWGHGRLGLDWSAQRGLLRIGLPMAGSLLMESGMFSAAALAIGRFGAVQVASHQIALNVAGVAFMVPLGIAYAMTVRIGRAVGEGDRAGIRRAGRGWLRAWCSARRPCRAHSSSRCAGRSPGSTPPTPRWSRVRPACCCSRACSSSATASRSRPTARCAASRMPACRCC